MVLSSDEEASLSESVNCKIAVTESLWPFNVWLVSFFLDISQSLIV